MANCHPNSLLSKNGIDANGCRVSENAMARRASRSCTQPGCSNVTPNGGRCRDCRSRNRDAGGTSAQRGYTGAHRSRFRPAVLARDPTCLCDLLDCPHHKDSICDRPSTVADHWPVIRRDLVDAGLDADDPARGRGLCASCHGRVTATTPATRGGFHHP